MAQQETYYFTMRNKQLKYKIECDRSDFKTMGMEGEHPNKMVYWIDDLRLNNSRKLLFGCIRETKTYRESDETKGS